MGLKNNYFLELSIINRFYMGLYGSIAEYTATLS